MAMPMLSKTLVVVLHQCVPDMRSIHAIAAGVRLDVKRQHDHEVLDA